MCAGWGGGGYSVNAFVFARGAEGGPSSSPLDGVDFTAEGQYGNVSLSVSGDAYSSEGYFVEWDRRSGNSIELTATKPGYSSQSQRADTFTSVRFDLDYQGGGGWPS